MAQQSPSDDRRMPGWIGRDERTRVLVRGSARRADGTELDVMVSDMSRGGCRLDCKQGSLNIGEWVEVEALGNLPQRGQVRWALLGAAGVRFNEF